MADIELDLDALGKLWLDLSKVCDKFGQSDGVGNYLKDAVGHHDLKDRLEDFGSSWDERREDMTADLDTVWHGVKLVQEAFVELDYLLGQKLQDALRSVPRGLVR